MTQFLTLINGVPRMRSESSSTTVYDEEAEIGVGGLATGNPLTLPVGGTYSSDELEVYLNGQRIDELLDYNFYGTIPRTAVTFTFDLVRYDKIRFRVDRPA